MPENKIFEFIKNEITTNEVVLFMKGTANSPECGFSAAVVAILNKFGIKFRDINVLTSVNLRQGIKDFTDWPTVPQLYIKGEFVGGCDIIREMYKNGEFVDLLNQKQISFITV